jgi:dipeptidyl aminopeptidase/acylaminoacyl peptidase
MNTHRFTIILLVVFITFGCSPAAATPSSPISPTKVTATAITIPVLSLTAEPSATSALGFSEECINLTETPLSTEELDGLIVLFDFRLQSYNSYFLDPKSNQLVDIEKSNYLSWDAPATTVSTTVVSPNNKFIQVNLWSKNDAIVRTIDEILNTYSIQGQEDWNRGRWLDNEHMVFQHWLDAPNGSYTVVIFNPFTGEQKNIRIDLPNPYMEEDIGGKLTWVKADIEPSLKRVLYNDKDERLVLWDLDTKKEIASLPFTTDLTEGTWSPDGKEFSIPSPSSTSSANELFAINVNGTVNKLTNFNQKYPFATVDGWPSWSPDGNHIAYWLKTSNVTNAAPETLRQWLAITNTTTLDTQIYCLSPNIPSTEGWGIIWGPDNSKLIVDTDVSSEDVKSILVDLTHLTQTTLDTHGLTVSGWMAP